MQFFRNIMDESINLEKAKENQEKVRSNLGEMTDGNGSINQRYKN